MWSLDGHMLSKTPERPKEIVSNYLTPLVGTGNFPPSVGWKVSILNWLWVDVALYLARDMCVTVHGYKCFWCNCFNTRLLNITGSVQMSCQPRQHHRHLHEIYEMLKKYMKCCLWDKVSFKHIPENELEIKLKMKTKEV